MTPPRQDWFLQVLQSAMVATITDAYSEFGAVGAAALRMTAERQGVKLSDEDRQKILGRMRELPPHPEVPESLDLLRDSGIRLAALTNSALQVAEARLENAGLADRFEQILSADAVKRLKPAPAPYRFAAESLGVRPGGLRLVAAHSWDVAGALRAGCAAAFVARHGPRPAGRDPGRGRGQHPGGGRKDPDRRERLRYLAVDGD